MRKGQAPFLGPQSLPFVLLNPGEELFPGNPDNPAEFNRGDLAEPDPSVDRPAIDLHDFGGLLSSEKFLRHFAASSLEPMALCGTVSHIRR